MLSEEYDMFYAKQSLMIYFVLSHDVSVSTDAF